MKPHATSIQGRCKSVTPRPRRPRKRRAVRRIRRLSQTLLLIVVVVFVAFRRFAGRGFFRIVGGDRLLLDTLHAVSENACDFRLGFIVARAIGIEIGLPIDHRAIGLIIDLEPELGFVVLDGEWALYDFVGVTEVLGAGELLLDLAAILERERAIGDVTLLGLEAIGYNRMPGLDGAKVTHDLPDLRR